MRGYLAILALVLLASGCAELQDHHYRMANQLRAHHAWKSFGTTCDSFGTPTRHYRDGWETGYYDVLTGGQPDPPAVPPKKYWDPKFQTPEGRAAIDEWYNGYLAGAMLATGSPIQSELPVRQDGLEPPFASGFAPIHSEHDREYVPTPVYPSFPVSVAPVRIPDRGSRRHGDIERISHAAVGPYPDRNRVRPAVVPRKQVENPSVNQVVVVATPAPVATEPSVHWGRKRTMFKGYAADPMPPTPRRLTEPPASTEQNIVIYRKPIPANDVRYLSSDSRHAH